MGCELRAAYGGYRSDVVRLGSMRLSENPNVGDIFIRRTGNAAATTVSQTTLTAPKGALKAYERGMDAVRKGNADTAEKEFTKATGLHPNFAAAWYELGHLQIDSNVETAKADFQKALAADPRFILPYMDLGILLYGEGKWVETTDITDRGLRLDATDFPLLYYFNAAAHYNLKQFGDDEKRVREAIKVDTDHSVPKADQLLAIILASKGDLQGATEHMRAYLASGPNEGDARQAQSQLALLEARLKSPAKNALLN